MTNDDWVAKAIANTREAERAKFVQQEWEQEQVRLYKSGFPGMWDTLKSNMEVACERYNKELPGMLAFEKHGDRFEVYKTSGGSLRLVLNDGARQLICDSTNPTQHRVFDITVRRDPTRIVVRDGEKDVNDVVRAVLEPFLST